MPKPDDVFWHEIAVEERYTLDWQTVVPIWIVGEAFTFPKLMPLTVSIDDPVWAAFGKSTRVTTGES